jgi:integrase
MARCRYRDSDGVTRIVERRSPANEHDQRGKLAEDALVRSLEHRHAPGVSGGIGVDTRISTLVEQHLALLAEAGKSATTLTTYRNAARQLARFSEALRVGDATPGGSTPSSVRWAVRRVRTRPATFVPCCAVRCRSRCSTTFSAPTRWPRSTGLSRTASPRVLQRSDAGALRVLLGKLAVSLPCEQADLIDPITMLAATGLRRSELLALR